VTELRPVRGSPTFEGDVRTMFSAISRRYSLFDHVSTLGGDMIWRSKALWSVDNLLKRSPGRILDIGCGPGDLTFLMSAHYPTSRIVGVDFTRAMVLSGEKARALKPAGGRVGFAVGDALRLPFRSSTFDLVTSAFLLRNLKDLKAGFEEMRRVLRPGGVLLALDLTEPNPSWFKGFFHAYFDKVVPVIGAAFHNELPYTYLSDSLVHFPPREKVMELLRGTGLTDVGCEMQWLGVVTGFLGRAPSG